MPYVSGRLAKLAKSIIEILLQETLAQLFPTVHAEGTVKCFSLKESWGKLLYECALNHLSSIGK